MSERGAEAAVLTSEVAGHNIAYAGEECSTRRDQSSLSMPPFNSQLTCPRFAKARKAIEGAHK